MNVKRAVGVLILAAMLGCAARATDNASPNGTLAYVGSYTSGGKSKGIVAFRFEMPAGSESVSLTPLGVAAEVVNPSFLAVDAKRRLLFSVNEVDKHEGKPTGAVSAFSMNPQTGMLTLLNQQASMGAGPCHVLIDKTGKNVLVANYGSGSVAVFPITPDGKLGDPSSVIQHRGTSIDPKRQEGPHAHCVTIDPANQFVFVCDLGLDKVMIYRFDAAAGKLTANDPPFATIKGGSGPRHMTFGADGKFAYVNNEMASTVTVFAYDAKAGALNELQTISTLPEGYKGDTSTAEIAVHPSGKFLYVSNRGHDSLAIFNIDQAKGTLTYVENFSTGGKTPRHFGIEPSGKYLIAENQGSGSMMVCAIDPQSGRLKSSGAMVEVGAPVCVVFVPAEKKE